MNRRVVLRHLARFLPTVITMGKMARNLELLAKADAYREAATAAANGKGSEPSENYVSLSVANLSKSYAKLSVKNIREVHLVDESKTACVVVTCS